MSYVYKRVTFFLLFFCYLSLPLVAQDEEPLSPLPTPWTLDEGWWKRLTENGDKPEKRIKELAQSLQKLEKQVPKDFP